MKKDTSRLKFNKKIFTVIICIVIVFAALVVKTNMDIKENNLVASTITEENVDVKLSKNSMYRLNLFSAYGDIDAYHPKVLYFEDGWNGYKYWISYTPYPNGDGFKENPHILVSNDMVDWKLPDGFTNPLDEGINFPSKKFYNSDSHLVMNTDLNQLECYWRYVDDEANTVTIYRRCTTDGVNWTEKEAVIVGNPRSKTDYVSPAIIYQDGMYKMWYVECDRTVKYMESTDAKEWSKPVIIEIDYEEDLQTWHLDVIETDYGYEMITVAFPEWQKRNDMNLYYTKSKDNKQWDVAKKVLEPSTGTKQWDNRGIYRSSFMKIDGVYYVYYSGQDTKGNKGVGLVFGTDMFNLKGTNINFAKDKLAGEKFRAIVEKETK